MRIIFIAAAAALLVDSGSRTLRAAQDQSSDVTLAVSGYASSTPSITVDGRTVAVVWTATKDGMANLYFAMSSNGGAGFSTPRRVNDVDGDAGATPEQPPRVVITGAANARVFTVVWSKRDPGPQATRRDVVRVSRSTDGGRTFSPARYVHDPNVSGARGWESVAAGADGRVHAAWLDGRDAARHIAELAKHGTPHKGQPPQDLYHGILSPDGRVVETLVATGVCFCCKTAVAVDARGAVYAAWRHIFPGSMRDIAFAKSIDGGRSFTPLVRVSEDNWQLNGCPEDGPAMAIENNGLIHLAWATVTNDAQPQKALFYTTSSDGKTFARRRRIPISGDTAPGHPQMVLTSGGAAIVFDEVVKGVRRVSLARVTASAVMPPDVLSGDEAASHPVIAGGTGGDLLVAWTSRSAGGAAGEASHIRITRIARR
jgi:hypothetical protein